MTTSDTRSSADIFTAPAAPAAPAAPSGTTGRRPSLRLVLATASLAVAIAASAVLVGADAANAATASGAPPARGAAVLAVNDLPTIVANLRNWVMGLLAGLATLFLTIGGARYLMAGGDPGEVERAKAAFRSAAVGYVLAIIAPVVLTVLNSIIGK
jgi:hypothetical protein